MQVITGWRDVPAQAKGAVLAIGNFDGMHRGHQAVLVAARAEAKHLGLPCVVLTFEPHPRAFFSRRQLFRLTPLPLKGALAAALGLDGTLVLDFDRALAEKSAEDFVREMLVEQSRHPRRCHRPRFPFRHGPPRHARSQGVALTASQSPSSMPSRRATRRSPPRASAPR